jgi:hypothetical protein
MAQRSCPLARGSSRAIQAVSLVELAWYFRNAHGSVPGNPPADPPVHPAAAAIRGVLDALPTYHVGALALRFTPRTWPSLVSTAFGAWAGVVVRLECAAYSSETTRPVEEREAHAAARLEADLLRARGARRLAGLERRARQYVRAALRAFVKARGDGPSVLPAARKEAP